MSGLLVATPLRLEALVIRSGAPRARVRTTGMGSRRARAAVPALLDRPGAALVVMGFGGGLDEHSEVGDVVVADALWGPDGERVTCPGAEALAEVLVSSLERHGLRVRRGAIVSVARPAIGEERRRLRESGAIAVDMESVWLAPGAGDRPFAVVRVIADTPTRELKRRLPGAPPLPALGDGLRATAALRRAAGALHEWTPGV